MDDRLVKVLETESSHGRRLLDAGVAHASSVCHLYKKRLRERDLRRNFRNSCSHAC